MSQTAKNLAIWRVALQLGTVVEPLGTIIGMVRALGRLAQTKTTQPAACATSAPPYATTSTRTRSNA